jgi:hypothetical protein
MNQAKFEAKRIQKDGKSAIEFEVRDSMTNPSLHAECVRLGMKLTVGISNRRAIVCSTPAEVATIQDAMRPFFVQ